MFTITNTFVKTATNKNTGHEEETIYFNLGVQLPFSKEFWISLNGRVWNQVVENDDGEINIRTWLLMGQKYDTKDGARRTINMSKQMREDIIEAVFKHAAQEGRKTNIHLEGFLGAFREDMATLRAKEMLASGKM